MCLFVTFFCHTSLALFQKHAHPKPKYFRPFSFSYNTRACTTSFLNLNVSICMMLLIKLILMQFMLPYFNTPRRDATLHMIFTFRAHKFNTRIKFFFISANKTCAHFDVCSKREHILMSCAYYITLLLISF